jgi:trk system potassium uptake protein TrkH
VTGLAVVDTGRDFSPVGQGVIMALIQLGGLGMMTFSVLALALAGRRASLSQEAAVRETFTAVATWRVGRLLCWIIGLTIAWELAGFLVMWRVTGDVWSSAFHAVSAFCNAGFSLNSDSLQREPGAVVVTVLLLFVAGGLGFTTLLEIGRALRPRRDGRARFSLHARLVLKMSILLWGLGTLGLALAERGDFGNACFLSASTRTAGFDTVSVSKLSGASLFLMIPLMFIGASPGSTGGGVKTTTLAIAYLVVRSTLKGRDRIVAYGREIPRAAVRRMFAVLGCSACIVFISIFLLHLFEGGHPDQVLAYAFEAASAFGTVGLSTGLTPSLQSASKALLCVVMFIGRVGSLSLFVLLVRDAAPSRVRYPEGKVMIG